MDILICALHIALPCLFHESCRKTRDTDASLGVYQSVYTEEHWRLVYGITLSKFATGTAFPGLHSQGNGNNRKDFIERRYKKRAPRREPGSIRAMDGTS